jgi:hypothetical protein
MTNASDRSMLNRWEKHVRVLNAEIKRQHEELQLLRDEIEI